jgi:hypothetical protein
MRLPRRFAPRSDKKGGSSQWQRGEKFLVLSISLCISHLFFVIASAFPLPVIASDRRERSNLILLCQDKCGNKVNSSKFLVFVKRRINTRMLVELRDLKKRLCVGVKNKNTRMWVIVDEIATHCFRSVRNDKK